jgi:chitinase
MSYKLPFFSILLITLGTCGTPTEEQSSIQPENPVIIGYIMGPRYENFDDIQADKLTHINYAFANIEDGRVVEGRPSDSLKFRALQRLRVKYPHLKILVSVGGWSWSDHFSDAALTAESREIFARSAKDFLVKYDLDGIDLDWEYPGQQGEDNVFRPEDKQHFTLFLKAVREQLDAQGKQDDRLGANKYLLTIATGANQIFLDHTDMAEAHQYLDYVNIMTYDYFTGGSSIAGHHTNLFHSDTDVAHQSGAQAVEEHLKAGIPAGKLVLGVAFYGRGWKITDNSERLYGTPREPGFSMPFHRVNVLTDSLGFTRMWDDAAKAPYLWQPDSMAVFTYDDPESLRHKCEYLKSKGLAGVMFWEYSGDNDGELLGTIHSVLSE